MMVAYLMAPLLVGCDDGTSVVYDLDGHGVASVPSGEAAVTVFLFTRTDCPISNRYAPTVARIHEEFAERGVDFYLVYVDPDDDAASIRRHVDEYSYPCDVLRDPHHALVRLTGASITPEAAVMTADGDLVYCGRIDNWYEAFGKARPAPTERNLIDVLEATLTGNAVETKRVKAVGCFIADLTPRGR